MAKKVRRDREESNINAPMQFNRPDINKIPCAKCAFRAADRKNGEIKGATLGTCEVYGIKPPGILFMGKHCPYFAE